MGRTNIVRSNLLRKQKSEVRKGLKEAGIGKIVPTFPRELTLYDDVVRKLQKRRISPQVISSMLQSKDPVLRKIVLKRVSLDPNLLKGLSLQDLRVLTGNSDPFVRETAAKALASFGEEALPELKVLAKDKIPFVRMATVKALTNLGKKALPELKRLTKDKDPFVHMGAINALASIKAKSGNLSKLKMLTKDKNPFVRKMAVKTLANFGEKTLPILKRLVKDESPLVRDAAVDALVTLFVKNGNLSELKALANDKNPFVRGSVAEALANFGEKFLPILKGFIKDKTLFVRDAAAEALANIFMKRGNLSELEMLARSGDAVVRRAALTAISKMSSKGLLLGERRPFAATPHLSILLKRVRTLKKISKKMRKKFGSGFTGIVVFGSTAKGYATPESDVDYAVIASDPAALKTFQELSSNAGLPLCREHYVNPKESIVEELAPLFYGLFFGDRKALRAAQRNAFLRFKDNPKAWEKIRETIVRNEINLRKAFERTNLGKREQARIIAAAGLRVPPPYNEMKKLLGIK